MSDPVIICGVFVHAIRFTCAGFVALTIEGREVWLDEDAAKIVTDVFAAKSRAAALRAHFRGDGR